MNLVYNEHLARKIQSLVKRKGLIEKRMFGGVAFMFNGNMCFGVVKDDLMVRVGPERYEVALALSNARPMDFTHRPTKGFVFVDSKGWSRNATLEKWLEMGLEYVGTLPKMK